MRYSIEPRTRKYVEGYGFLSFARNFSNKYRKRMLDTGVDALKPASIKVVHKSADKIVKTKLVIDENSRNVEEIIIPIEEREEIWNELRQVL